jgi:hypothetical protein
MLLQLHVADDLRQDRPRRVRQSRTTESRMKLIGNGSPANLRPTLEHKRFVSSLSQIERSDQSIVAAANNHNVATPGAIGVGHATPLP